MASRDMGFVDTRVVPFCCDLIIRVFTRKNVQYKDSFSSL